MNNIYKSIPTYNTNTEEWSYTDFTRESFINYLESIYKIPGEFNFDKRINIFRQEAINFSNHKYYYNKPKGTRDYKLYWDRQKEFCLKGMIVDNMYISGWHYMYLNFLPIKVKLSQSGKVNETDLPDFRDLDVWFYNIKEYAEAKYKHTVSLKSRQKGWFQPYSCKVLKKEGFVELGSLKVGDEIYTKDGSLTKVTEIFEQGLKDVYEVVFQDGRKTRCGINHLWEVFDKTPRCKKWKTLSTQQIIDTLFLRDAKCNGKSYVNTRYAIPENECLQFEKQDLIVHPYLLGCLLGDGSLRDNGSVALTSMDNEILENCMSTLDDTFYYNNGEKANSKADRFIFKNKNTYNTDYNTEHYGDTLNYKYGYNPLSRDIETLGLRGKTTYDKFIPEKYLYSDKQDRIELLQGLMDTDGYVNNDGMDLQYTTVNEKLSEQVAFLCRSLGITINIDKKPAAKDTHKDYYRVRLSGVINFPIFKLERKLERFNKRKDFGKTLNRFRYCNIVSITKLDYQEQSRCITVDHDSHLYLTDDLIVTHNTIKTIVPLIRSLWFEKDQVCKILVPDERFVKKSWSDIIEPFRNHLNSHTAWYRSFSPDKTLDWKQQIETIENGRKIYKGTGSTLLGFTTKGSLTSAVGGSNSRILLDEQGTNPNLISLIRYLVPSLEAGAIVTGFIDVVGAVGELKDAEDLKSIFYQPEANGFLGIKDIFDNTKDNVGLFVPHNWGLEGFIDVFGNSKVKLAEDFIIEQREEKKKLSPKDYQLYVSQYPLKPSEAFLIREENIYPTDIIQPRYEKLLRNPIAIPITILEQNGKLTHKLGSEAPPVRDFPIKKETDKRGCIEMVEAPLYDNPPMGLYYGSCDPVTQIKTVTSDSLQSFGIYRSDFYQGDVFIPGKRVAWYAGRYDNVDITFEMCRKLMQYYNARTMIESDKDGFIKWLIGKKENILLMKRSEYPRLQEIIPNSKIFDDYGIKKGSSKNFENHLHETNIRYITEEIGTDYDADGNSIPIYGVERIDDIMLLREFLEYNSRVNTDRLYEFAYGLDVAEGNTLRQRLHKIKEDTQPIQYKPIKLNPFNNYQLKSKSIKINPFGQMR